MKIGVTTFGCDHGRSGLGRYAIQLIRSLVPFQDDFDIEILTLEQDRSIFLPDQHGFSVRTIPSFWRSPLRNIAWHQFMLGRYSQDYDLLFIPSANRRLPFFSRCPVIGMVPDFSPLHIQGKYDLARTFYVHHILPILIRRLTQVITISECTKRDLLSVLGIDESAVKVVYLGIDHAQFYPHANAVSRPILSANFGIHNPYLLYVSRIEHPGKNHVGLIHAFSKLKSQYRLPHQLVLAGPLKERSHIVQKVAAESEFSDDIIFTGFVQDSDLPHLYSAADLFVFPSFYEGFGFPVLESMACGVPVVCSNTSSLPEISGSAARFFDPHNEADMVSTIYSVLSDPCRHSELRELGLSQAQKFTWEKTIQETVSFLLNTVKTR